MKRRLIAGTVAVAAVAVVAIAASVEAPSGDAIPPIWPLPATVLGAAAFALGVHTLVTDRLRPVSVAATAVTVLLAVLATAPTFNYTWHSPSASYLLLGVTVLPAALGAAVKRANRRLVWILGAAVVALGVVAGVWNTSRSVPAGLAVHLVRSVPAGLVGYALTTAVE